jgi:hypothetical protein
MRSHIDRFNCPRCGHVLGTGEAVYSRTSLSAVSCVVCTSQTRAMQGLPPEDDGRAIFEAAVRFAAPRYRELMRAKDPTAGRVFGALMAEKIKELKAKAL